MQNSVNSVEKNYNKENNTKNKPFLTFLKKIDKYSFNFIFKTINIYILKYKYKF